MPGTVDDFMRRFGGGGASMTGKPSSIMTALRPRTPMIARLTLRRWRRAPPNTWANYRTSTSRKPPHRVRASASRAAAGMAEQRIGRVTRPGVDLGGLQSQLGLPSLSPNEMGPDAYARVATYARRQHPDVMEEQVRSQPWFVKAMGNPMVMGALGVIASKLPGAEQGCPPSRRPHATDPPLSASAEGRRSARPVFRA